MKPPKHCPICNSGHWVKINDRHSGYSFSKAFWVNLFFGKYLGALAGSLGKRKQLFYCYDCSCTLEYEF